MVSFANYGIPQSDSCLRCLVPNHIGTFWLVHGCSMIPWFGVGVNYSATGDNLGGQATPEFFATTGE